MKPEEAFHLFGLEHLGTLGFIFSISLVLVIIKRRTSSVLWARIINLVLASFLLGNELLSLWEGLSLGQWDITRGLPLHLCDLAVFACAYSLFRKNQVIWELAYFWGLGGTLQALMTPDLQYGFPHAQFIKFFITHGTIIISVIYLAVGYQLRITRSSLGRVWWITNIYALLIGFVNWLLKANYLYLCHKPSQPSLLDYLGPWPWYIIGLEAVLILSLYLYYLPFHWVKRRTKNQ